VPILDRVLVPILLERLEQVERFKRFSLLGRRVNMAVTISHGPRWREFAAERAGLADGVARRQFSKAVNAGNMLTF
jgi:hypothetical protein